MYTIALIGPDGAGKTTVAKNLLNRLPVPVQYLYMGVSNDSSNRVLPTTYLIRKIKRACGAPRDVNGPPPLRSAETKPVGGVRGFVRGAKSMVSLIHRLSEEWFRQLLTWSYQWRGYVVLYDRHYFIDYFAYDVAPCSWKRPLARRIHGFILDKIYPKPDLVIYLDAPSEVLFARKGEGTIEDLERRRRDYLAIRSHVNQFVVVDANRPLETVTRDVIETISTFHRNWTDRKQGLLSRLGTQPQPMSAGTAEHKP